MVDLSRVWVVADLFPSEAPHLAYIKAGAAVRMSLPQYPHRTFTARASNTLPEFDSATSTLKVRIEAGNPDFELRPDMLVDVEIDVNLPAALTIPADAAIWTGLVATAFVDRGNGYYEPRTVETRWQADNRLQISQRPGAGGAVVALATFLVDSESRLHGASTRIASLH